MKKKDIEHVIIGTAGHIDHGKTALVKALTGIDADTLPEEKRRGMTIELGFVFLDIPDYEKQIVFIDVPGHEKFVKTMVAGASNVDGALLVIAADEGINQQTREHFEILHLLHIKIGIICLTKCDLVQPDRIHDLTEEVRSFVKNSFLENASIFPTSIVTGEGVDAVKKSLIELGRSIKTREDSNIFRMPIDRVFTMKGFGTVIAGTVLSGRVKVGDIIEIYPDGIKTRIRSIQVHDTNKPESFIGRRTALNLHDVKKAQLRRGQVAGAPSCFSPSYWLDTRLNLLESYGKPLNNRTRVRLHVGTDERIGRIVLLDSDVLLPGQSGLIQFALEAPTVALKGDAFVIRSFSPIVTIGGGTILDGNPARHKRFDQKIISGLKKLEGGLEEQIDQVFLNAGFNPITVKDVAVALDEELNEVTHVTERLVSVNQLLGIDTEKGNVYLHRSWVEMLKKQMLDAVKLFFQKNPHRLYMPYADLRSQLQRLTDIRFFPTLLNELLVEKTLSKQADGINLPNREPVFAPREQELNARIEKIFKTSGFASPLEEDIRKQLRLHPNEFKKIFKGLYDRNILVKLNNKVTYHREILDSIKAVLLDHCRNKGGITIAELRDRLKLSRKYAQAALEYFDRIGLTYRKDDKHVLK